jgi:hypothetical protein
VNFQESGAVRRFYFLDTTNLAVISVTAIFNCVNPRYFSKALQSEAFEK